MCNDVFPIHFPLFFFNDTATTELYTLSLHDALPICLLGGDLGFVGEVLEAAPAARGVVGARRVDARRRSEEHTSELQSQSNLVCRLLLEKKNTMTKLLPRTWRSYSAQTQHTSPHRRN